MTRVCVWTCLYRHDALFGMACRVLFLVAEALHKEYVKTEPTNKKPKSSRLQLHRTQVNLAEEAYAAICGSNLDFA